MLEPALKDALARHAGQPWRGSGGDVMVSVRFDALASEGFDPAALLDEVLEAGGSVSDRDAPTTGSAGIRRSAPKKPDAFVIPLAALSAIETT